MMRKLLAVALAGAAFVAMAPAAQAASCVAPGANCSISFDGLDGIYAASEIPGSSAGTSFTHTFTFNTTLPGLAGADITTLTVRFHGLGDIDFGDVTLDGSPFTMDPDGLHETGFVFTDVAGGDHTLEVNGTSYGNGKYDGTLSFAPVPEPATWAMMIMGFGAIGVAARTARRKHTVPMVLA